MSDVSLSDIHRLKGILRSHGLHEDHCNAQALYKWSKDENGEWSGQPCNCFLSEDPFDMEKDPPLRNEGFSNIAVESRRHRYSDGRTRIWTKKRDGDWGEVT